MPHRGDWSLGLSPLTRGNPPSTNDHFSPQGPIPAHAGEPCLWLIKPSIFTAYPRSRGGTVRVFSYVVPRGGLSPLTRGNLALAFVRWPCLGPIPAHAGEPRYLSAWLLLFRAYPRSRGGTMLKPKMSAAALGLSPLTRGNPGDFLNPGALHGPIPAHAGEPRHARLVSRRGWAYPRSRGGTHFISAAKKMGQGLSPLTRGNRIEIFLKVAGHGPIPAHAGEPVAYSARAAAFRAYPRSRGGTSRQS